MKRTVLIAALMLGAGLMAKLRPRTPKRLLPYL